MSVGVIEKEIFSDVSKFFKPGVNKVTTNGSESLRREENKKAFIEAFSDEAVEVAAGVVVTGLVAALSGGSILLPGVIGFGTAVALKAYRKVMGTHHELAKQKATTPQAPCCGGRTIKNG